MEVFGFCDVWSGREDSNLRPPAPKTVLTVFQPFSRLFFPLLFSLKTLDFTKKKLYFFSHDISPLFTQLAHFLYHILYHVFS